MYITISMGCYCCFNLCILIAHVLVNFVSKAIHLFSLSLSSCPFVTHSFGYPFSFLLFCKTFFHSFAFERKTLLELRPVYRAAPHFNFVIIFLLNKSPLGLGGLKYLASLFIGLKTRLNGGQHC